MTGITLTPESAQAMITQLDEAAQTMRKLSDDIMNATVNDFGTTTIREVASWNPKVDEKLNHLRDAGIDKATELSQDALALERALQVLKEATEEFTRQTIDLTDEAASSIQATEVK